MSLVSRLGAVRGLGLLGTTVRLGVFWVRRVDRVRLLGLFGVLGVLAVHRVGGVKGLGFLGEVGGDFDFVERAASVDGGGGCRVRVGLGRGDGLVGRVLDLLGRVVNFLGREMVLLGRSGVLKEKGRKESYVRGLSWSGDTSERKTHRLVRRRVRFGVRLGHDVLLGSVVLGVGVGVRGSLWKGRALSEKGRR